MHIKGHNTGKNATGDPRQNGPKDAEQPGYETSDANVGGVVVFLCGLAGTLVVFLFFCFYMGRAINAQWQKQDGPATKWTIASGAAQPGGRGRDLVSNPEIEQRQLQQVTGNFPEPRLDIDDGNQATADLHAREDLLLQHYSLVDGQPGTIRIPIERAMQLIVQRGLPVANQTSMAADSVAYAARTEMQAPLTTGFARTGFELTTIDARKQQMIYSRAAESPNAQATPAK